MSILTAETGIRTCKDFGVGTAQVLRNLHKIIMILAVSLLIPLQTVLAENQFQQGINYFDNADYARAYSFLRELEPEFRSNAGFQYYYGLSLYMTDDARQAVDVMQRAVELDRNNAEYHYGRVLTESLILFNVF